jgi:preprotein translocase subunit SecA
MAHFFAPQRSPDSGMLTAFVRRLVGTKNSRELKRMRRVVERINALEPQFEALDDAGLRAMTAKFRERLAAGETLDQLLPEAFAAVREAGAGRSGCATSTCS